MQPANVLVMGDDLLPAHHDNERGLVKIGEWLMHTCMHTLIRVHLCICKLLSHSHSHTSINKCTQTHSRLRTHILHYNTHTRAGDLGLARIFQATPRPLSENGIVVTIW